MTAPFHLRFRFFSQNKPGGKPCVSYAISQGSGALDSLGDAEMLQLQCFLHFQDCRTGPLFPSVNRQQGCILLSEIDSRRSPLGAKRRPVAPSGDVNGPRAMRLSGLNREGFGGGYEYGVMEPEMKTVVKNV